MVVAFSVSRASSGLLQAVLFMVALYGTALTVALVIARLVNPWLDRSRRRPLLDARSGMPGRKRHVAAKRARCSSCRRFMERIEPIWVCPHCDAVTSQRE